MHAILTVIKRDNPANSVAEQAQQFTHFRFLGPRQADRHSLTNGRRGIAVQFRMPNIRKNDDLKGNMTFNIPKESSHCATTRQVPYSEGFSAQLQGGYLIRQTRDDNERNRRARIPASKNISKECEDANLANKKEHAMWIEFFINIRCLSSRKLLSPCFDADVFRSTCEMIFYLQLQIVMLAQILNNDSQTNSKNCYQAFQIKPEGQCHSKTISFFPQPPNQRLSTCKAIQALFSASTKGAYPAFDSSQDLSIKRDRGIKQTTHWQDQTKPLASIAQTLKTKCLIYLGC